MSGDPSRSNKARTPRASSSVGRQTHPPWAQRSSSSQNGTPPPKAKSPVNFPGIRGPSSTPDRLAAIEDKLSHLSSLEGKIDTMLAQMSRRGSGNTVSSTTEGSTHANAGKHLRHSSSQDGSEASGSQQQLPLPQLPTPSLDRSGSNGKPHVPRSFKSVSLVADSDTEDEDDEAMAAKLQDNLDDIDRPLALVVSDEWMINPRNRFRMFWDLCVVMPLLVYLTVVMPFRLCLENEAPNFTYMYWFEFMIDMLFIMDIVFNFRTGVPVKVDEASTAVEDSEVIEYDRWIVAWEYAKTWLVLDVVSGVPFALIELLMAASGGSDAVNQLKSAKALKLLRFLKLGRLLKLEKILGNLDMDTLDTIEDFMQDGRTRSMVVMMKLLLYLAYSCHLLACGFLVAGKVHAATSEDEFWDDGEGGPVGREPSWFDKQFGGPYLATDTTGINGDDKVYTLYVAAFYFTLTTMTSVGYGDIITWNNTERLYVIMCEFFGAIIFAAIIASITSVVSSMDMNTRKKAEQLDAVSSFVVIKAFPYKMGRRIRRHFRHYYSLKSAIDESKIFSELSTSLRREVSEYLITELMGRESFFMTLSPTFWPRLLPLLRPMGIAHHETLCQQGEECSDMYVVVSGVLKCETVVPGEVLPRARHVTTGGAVNVLHALCIWHECLETVTAIAAVESYAVSSHDFEALFRSSNDQVYFQAIKEREMMSFHMEPNEDAPTQHGKPLYYSCFSMVEVSLVDLKGALLSLSNTAEEGVWAVVDLVEKTSGRPFNEFWRFRSEKRLPVPLTTSSMPRFSSASLDSGVGRSEERSVAFLIRSGTDRQSDKVPSEVVFGESVQWNDVSMPFSRCAVRVRLFSAGSRGKDQLLGKATIDLSEVEKTAEATVFDTEVGKSHRASTTTNQALKPNKFDTPSTIGGGGSSRIGAQMPKTSGEVEMQARPMDQRQRRASRGDLDSCSTPPKISDWLVHNPLRYNEVETTLELERGDGRSEAKSFDTRSPGPANAGESITANVKSERGFGWASTNPGLRIRVLAKRPERRIKSIKRVLAEQQQAAEQGVNTPSRTSLKRGATSMPNLELPKKNMGNNSSGEFKAQNSGTL